MQHSSQLSTLGLADPTVDVGIAWGLCWASISKLLLKMQPSPKNIVNATKAQKTLEDCCSSSLFCTLSNLSSSTPWNGVEKMLDSSISTTLTLARPSLKSLQTVIGPPIRFQEGRYHVLQCLLVCASFSDLHGPRSLFLWSVQRLKFTHAHQILLVLWCYHVWFHGWLVSRWRFICWQLSGTWHSVVAKSGPCQACFMPNPLAPRFDWIRTDQACSCSWSYKSSRHWHKETALQSPQVIDVHAWYVWCFSWSPWRIRWPWEYFSKDPRDKPGMIPDVSTWSGSSGSAESCKLQGVSQHAGKVEGLRQGTVSPTQVLKVFARAGLNSPVVSCWVMSVWPGVFFDCSRLLKPNNEHICCTCLLWFEWWVSMAPCARMTHTHKSEVSCAARI